MRNSLTRFKVSLEGLTFGLLEIIHWSRFRIIDLSIAGTRNAFNRGFICSFDTAYLCCPCRYRK